MTGPGWDAIDGAVRRLYGAAEPKHWGTLIAWALGGPDPLDAVRCWEADGHWHFVSYGLRARGFELTFRLARRPRETAPPEWAVARLQALARYVFRSGNDLCAGEHVDLNGALGGDDGTQLRAVAFTDDPELGAIDTPHGRVRFVQLVGVTLDELEAMKDWSTEGVLSLLEQRSPKLVTDPARRSIREDAALEAEIQAGIARDGSSHGAAYVEQLDWSRRKDGSLHLLVGAIAVPDLRRVLRGRIPYGRPFTLEGAHATVVFRPAGMRARTDDLDDDTLVVELTPEHAEALHDVLDPRAGRYHHPAVPDLTIEVEQTEVRDSTGDVVRVVG